MRGGAEAERDERARPPAEAGDGRVKRDMAAAQLEREAKLRMMAEGEQVELFHEMASKLQNAYRGRIGRKKAEQQRKRMQIIAQHAIAAVKIQGAMRGCLGRMFVKKILEAQMRELVLGASATNIQKAYRGMVGRHARARDPAEPRCALHPARLPRPPRADGGRARARAARGAAAARRGRDAHPGDVADEGRARGVPHDAHPHRRGDRAAAHVPRPPRPQEGAAPARLGERRAGCPSGCGSGCG